MASLTFIISRQPWPCGASSSNYLDMAPNEMLESSIAETVQDEFLGEQLEYARECEKASKPGISRFTDK
ncbi:hypothetical protein JY97_09145 [Alkalispirochaeta odontotermitis]|nr:hypothetical protein JY97_09145 [Alkalispirochaeta odontotermitis]